MQDFQTELDRLTGLKGGPKHMWLKQHQDLVIQFHHEFGEEATKQTFHLKGTTLHNLLDSTTVVRNYRLTKADRALAQAEIVRADIQQIRQEVKLLKQLFERFQLSVGEQLIEKFFIPLLQAGIRVDTDFNLPEKDILSLHDLPIIKKPLPLKHRRKKKG